MNLDGQTRQLLDEIVRFMSEDMDRPHERSHHLTPDLVRQLIDPVVRGHVERIARVVLSHAMDECEEYAKVQSAPGAQLALKQAAIRIAKLAPSVANNPKGGPKKALR